MINKTKKSKKNRKRKKQTGDLLPWNCRHKFKEEILVFLFTSGKGDDSDRRGTPCKRQCPSLST